MSMMVAHKIHKFLFPLNANNILSVFSVGSVSAYYYAQKIESAISSIAIGPSKNVFVAKTSELWSSGKIHEMKLLVKQFLKSIPIVYMLISFVVFLMLPFILKFIGSYSLSQSFIQLIKNIFIFLVLWQTVIILESPFVGVGISSKNSKIFILTNSIFIMLFCLMAIILKGSIGIFSVPIAAFFAQMVSISIYSLYALMLLKVERFRILYKPFKLFLKPNYHLIYPNILAFK
jgi:hypothetical protein